MNSNISPSFYFSENIFNQEKEAIFKRNWNFVGFKNQLANPNDFITRSIGETPVLVQNIKGEIKSFLNVCSHRFSLLKTEQTGNGPLVCPYHGWSYNSDGIPTGIPKKPLFKNFSNQELCDMKLQTYKIDFCGNLVFVCLNNDALNLKNYLGDFYQEIESLSVSANLIIDENQLDIAANWKVIVENTLESYHVGMIHTNTFRRLGASGLKFNFTNYHSNWEADLTINRTDESLNKINQLFETSGYLIEGYKHILIFPNLLISTTHGTSYNFSLIEPLSPDLTRFTSYVFLAQTQNMAKKSLLAAYRQALIDFNREVFKEDKDICQEVQKGVRHTIYQGVLSLEEERVHAFQKIYTKLIGSDAKN